MNKTLVYIEQRDNKIKKASLEALSKAIELAEGNDLEAVVFGNEIENFDLLNGTGLKKLIHYKSPELEKYSSNYNELLVKHFNDNGFDTLIMAKSSMSADIAPVVSVKLEAGLAQDCVDIEKKNDDLVATRPVYAGKALIDVKINSEKKIFTLRPNVFQINKNDGDNPEIEVVEPADLNGKTKVVEIKKSSDKLDVAEAEIIVSGGRGLKEASNFSMIEELAEKLNAAVGASRAVVDAGWRPHSEQVGQTGKTVSPNLYIAVGISGAIQHLAGMRSSKYIVAINKDKEAPIFNIADYGIAGDAFEVVPALIEELDK